MLNKDFAVSSPIAIPSSYNKRQFYFMPHPALRRYIAHYTFSYSVAERSIAYTEEAKELVLIPDGSGCMIFIFDDDGLYDSCWGPTSQPVRVAKDNSTRNERMFFIEFLPGGLHALTGIPQKHMRNIQCSIYDVERGLTNALKEVVMISGSVDELVARVDRILLREMETMLYGHDVVMSTLCKIKQAGGNVSIKALAESEYVSERHLSRLFEGNIGLNVKTFSRLVRINKAVKLFKSSQYNSLYIAQETGFYDESHLIHDFNQFCSATPSTFVKKMSDFYNEPFKY